jgi:hypothetical protein
MKSLDFKIFYENLTSFTPYVYQARVAELLLAGKNIVLSVPTGAGKTWGLGWWRFDKIKIGKNFFDDFAYILRKNTIFAL